MEVHQHTHTPRQKWTHYLWEFIMLFLAVFCGFLAENIREHKIERKKEKQYITSLVQDLKEDTADLQVALRFHILSHKMIDTLIRELNEPGLDSRTARIYYLARKIILTDPTILVRDRTFEQLKSSGGLRLIHDPNVLDSIAGYYQDYRWITTGPSVMQIYNRQQATTYLDKIFNIAIFQKMVAGGNWGKIQPPEGNPPLLSKDPGDINTLCGRYHAVYLTKQLMINSISNQINYGARLLTLLKKEYHLE